MKKFLLLALIAFVAYKLFFKPSKEAKIGVETDTESDAKTDTESDVSGLNIYPKKPDDLSEYLDNQPGTLL